LKIKFLLLGVIVGLSAILLIAAVDILDHDGTKAEDCYNGRGCGPLPASPCPGGVCKNKITVLACYTCCSDNGCTASPLTRCQALCDNKKTIALSALGISVDFLNDYDATYAYVRAMGHRYLENGNFLTDADVSVLDLVISKFSIENPERETVARLALVLLLEAHHTGRIDCGNSALLETVVGEIHHAALFNLGDCGIRSSARSIGARYGIQGNRDPIEDRQLIIEQIALEGLEGMEQDQNLLPLLLNN
jgi:hypothetical protein